MLRKNAKKKMGLDSGFKVNRIPIYTYYLACTCMHIYAYVFVYIPRNRIVYTCTNV